MSKVCTICGKKPSTGHNVSHSVRRTKRTFKPNLVVKRLWDVTRNAFFKTRICTKCLRTLKKQEV
ncbi:MAG: 50S ribosomal protein L28 [Candidatus Gracilibacteria bacterium]|jgi:large subunit ribosomal protein L28|nr:50S ribosomal protein L28 [Candidatus Gracilibacteria bacterium]